MASAVENEMDKKSQNTQADGAATEVAEGTESLSRPSSAMSGLGSPSSRIPVPRINRSTSLRLKSASKSSLLSPSDYKSYNPDSSENSKWSRSPDQGNRTNRNVMHPERYDVTPPPKLVRSSSFVTSRGMKGLTSSSHHNLSRPPDSTRSVNRDPFKRFSYVSPYSKKAIASERKTQSFAGVNSSCRHNNPHCQHVIKQTSSSTKPFKRPNFLPLSPVVSPSPDQAKEQIFDKSPTTPSDIYDFDQDHDDTDSVKSFDSINSAMSCDTAMKTLMGHQRSRKYVVHCSHNLDIDPDDYLTPTQRAARKIRELKNQLIEARKEITAKQEQITSLTREMVLLRLHKIQNDNKTPIDSPVPPVSKPTTPDMENSRLSTNSLSNDRNRLSPKACFTPPSPGSSEPELLRLSTEENPISTSSPQPPIINSPTSMAGTVDSADASQRSLADSGNYDDLASPCLSVKDSMDSRKTTMHSHDELDEDNAWAEADAIEDHLRRHYEQQISEMKRNNLSEYNELKERHNDKVESLLAKLSEANLKYFELRPKHDRCVEKLKEAEVTIQNLKTELEESERKHQKMYLQMYLKGQQAAKIEAEDNAQCDIDTRSRGSIDESSNSLQDNKATMVGLVKQLTHTEEELEKLKVLYNREVSLNKRQGSSRDSANSSSSSLSVNQLDPEVTLQFLKSAIYYFLTDRDNSRGHLKAIESILGYTSSEKKNIEKVFKI